MNDSNLHYGDLSDPVSSDTRRLNRPFSSLNQHSHPAPDNNYNNADFNMNTNLSNDQFLDSTTHHLNASNDTFSVAIHNVQGMCAPTTQESIINNVKLCKLDIVGLVETHLTSQ
jgi:hypothetical protein